MKGQTKYGFLLGRNVQLSIAELGALLSGSVQKVATAPLAVYEGELPAADAQSFINRIGGCTEIVKIFAQDVGREDMVQKIVDYLSGALHGSKGKTYFAINAMEDKEILKHLRHFLKGTKKALREQGIQAAFLNKNIDENVSSVAAFKNRLHYSQSNIWIVRQSADVYTLAASVAMQNFERYSDRDYGKPFRDARAGMLPPKLAQMLVNLATQGDSTEKYKVYDPFCGTGTVLMEAALMGYDSIGSDIAPRMVEGTEQNMAWLRQKFGVKTEARVFHSPAQNITKDSLNEGKIVIATEGFLGPPLTQEPAPKDLERIQSEIEAVHLPFLAEAKSYASCVVMTLPYWRFKSGHVYFLDRVIDKITELGYIMSAFAPLTLHRLQYERPDQMVGREIVRFVPE